VAGNTRAIVIPERLRYDQLIIRRYTNKASFTFTDEDRTENIIRLPKLTDTEA